MRDGEDLLGRVGSALPIVQDRFRSERRKRDRNARPTGRIKSVVSGSLASCHLRYRHLFGLLRPELVAKTSLRSNRGGHLKMKRQIPNINIVRSAWRRVKKDIKDAIIRDLRPVKDVKGGRRVTGESKPARGEGTTGTTDGH